MDSVLVLGTTPEARTAFTLLPLTNDNKGRLGITGKTVRAPGLPCSKVIARVDAAKNGAWERGFNDLRQSAKSGFRESNKKGSEEKNRDFHH